MTFVLQITGTVAALLLVFVGIPWMVGRVKARRAKTARVEAAFAQLREHGERLDGTWKQLQREALVHLADGLARDAANLRGDWQRALAAETSHSHRPMPGMDPEVLP